MAYLNWTPVVESLLHHLEQVDARATAVHDGDEWLAVASAAEAVDAATDVESAFIKMRRADGASSTLWLVFDNEPEELVADWTYNEGWSDQWVDAAISSFCQEWEGKPCPRVKDQPLAPAATSDD
jgi:hypothetical protein